MQPVEKRPGGHEVNTANFKLVLGIALLLGGLVIPAGILIPAFNAPNETVEFESPGQATLDIEAPGRFYLWHDYRTIHEGRQVVRGEHLPNGMSFDVVRVGNGSALTLQPRGSIHTELRGASSRSIGYVDVERPGTLRIEVSGGDDQTRVMSFSRSRFMMFARAVGFSILSLVLLGSAGTVLIVLGIVHHARKS